MLKLGDEPPKKSCITSKKSLEPNQCTICLKLFTQNYNMTQNIRQIHSKESQHPCTCCKTMFTQRNNLTRHVNSVHKKLREKCAICEKEFSRRRSLVEHVKAVHEKLRE